MTLPTILVSDFYKRLNNMRNVEHLIIPKRDVEYAKEIIALLGEEEAKAFISFALDEAPKTNYNMQSFRAIEPYIVRWHGEQANRAERIERDKKERKEKEVELINVQYDDYCKLRVFDYLSQASAGERDEIRKLAEIEALKVDPAKSMVFETVVKQKERVITRDRIKVPSFQEWLELRD